jgi:prolyl-tRNA synthetase
VRAGDPAPDGEGVLEAARGIEIGHIFQLGRKYADAFALDALGPDSRPVRITMGSYGIGVSRLVAAIAEQCHDEHGLVWPRSVAPFDVHLVAAGKQAEIRDGAEALAGQLDAAGLRVLLDDRTASPGVKFADAELVGVPTIVVVGRGLASGVIEVKDRRTGERTEVALDSAVEHLAELTRKR